MRSWIGLALELLALPLLVAFGVLWYRRSIGRAEEDRARHNKPSPMDQQRLIHVVHPAAAAGRESAEPADLPDLQITARTMLHRRIFLLLVAACAVVQLGGLLLNPSWFRVAFIVLVALIAVPATVQIIRHSRAARAFLQRYPDCAEPHQGL